MTSSSTPIVRTAVLAVAISLAGCDSSPPGDTRPTGSAASSPTAAAQSQHAQLLDAAIAATGGLEKLKAASSWRAKISVTFTGEAPESGELTYRIGAARLQLKTAAGRPFGIVNGVDRCAGLEGPVVIPCSADRTEQAMRYHVAYEAKWLWPLKSADWTLEVGQQQVDDQPFDTITARKKGQRFDVTLYFDPKTHLLARLAVPYRVGGKTAVRSAVFTDYRTSCGIKFPMQEIGYLDDRKILTEQLSDVRCGRVSDADVVVPQQVADGTVQQRRTAPATVLCHTKRGAYAGAAARLEQLQAKAEHRKLRLTRAASMLVLVKARTPGQAVPEVAEVCVDVGAAAPETPEKDGDFVLRREPARPVLAAYGVGAYDKKLATLSEQLEAEAKKRSLRPSNDVRQLWYMPPQTGTEAERVCELQAVLSER